MILRQGGPLQAKPDPIDLRPPPGTCLPFEPQPQPGMPRDELGLDPYQASAVSCAKKGAIGSAALALCAIGLMIYGTSGGAGETYTYLGMGAFAGAVVSFCLANRWALAPRLLLSATPSAVLSALARVAVQVTQQGGHPLGRRLLS